MKAGQEHGELGADAIASRKPTGSLLRRAFDFESVLEDPRESPKSVDHPLVVVVVVFLLPF